MLQEAVDLIAEAEELHGFLRTLTQSLNCSLTRWHKESILLFVAGQLSILKARAHALCPGASAGTPHHPRVTSRRTALGQSPWTGRIPRPVVVQFGVVAASLPRHVAV